MVLWALFRSSLRVHDLFSTDAHNPIFSFYENMVGILPAKVKHPISAPGRINRFHLCLVAFLVNAFSHGISGSFNFYNYPISRGSEGILNR